MPTVNELYDEIKALRNELNVFINIFKQQNIELKSVEKQVSVLPVSKPVNTDKKISDILIDYQISVSIKGFRFLKEAIKIYMDDPGATVTKIIYPNIAKKFNDTPIRVERAIRHAIQTSWDKARDYYPKSYSIGKPTNSEFIALVAEKLILENQEESA